MDDKTIKRCPVIITNQIMNENISNECDKIMELYVIINDTIMVLPVIIPKDIFLKTPDTETKKRKLSIETNEDNNKSSSELQIVKKTEKENEHQVPEHQVPEPRVPEHQVPEPRVPEPRVPEHRVPEPNVALISPVYISPILSDMIKYINSLSDKFNCLYITLNQIEHSEFISYFRECFRNHTLQSIINYINRNIPQNIGLTWKNQNPEIYYYIVKYPIFDNDNYETITNIKYKTDILVVFCDKVIKWINYCLENNIANSEQIKFLSVNMDIFDKFFYENEYTVCYWNKYRLNIPMHYIYQKFNNNIKIIRNSKYYIYSIINNNMNN